MTRKVPKNSSDTQQSHKLATAIGLKVPFPVVTCVSLVPDGTWLRGDQSSVHKHTHSR